MSVCERVRDGKRETYERRKAEALEIDMSNIYEMMFSFSAGGPHCVYFIARADLRKQNYLYCDSLSAKQLIVCEGSQSSESLYFKSVY